MANELSTAADLRTVYRPAKGGPVDKVIDRIDPHCVEFLSKSPFFVLSTADENGVCDGSPKGGHPGFVRALDEHRVAWADLSGNNRLDSFENIVRNSSVALLFMIPGLDETLRINGTATLTTDTEVCEQVSVEGKPAKVAVVVDVAEAYIHCAKAYRRAQLWSPDSWLDEDDVPDGRCMFRDHAKMEIADDVLRSAYEASMESTMWKQAGDTD